MNENSQSTALTDTEIQPKLNAMVKASKPLLIIALILVAVTMMIGIPAGIAQQNNGEEISTFTVVSIFVLFTAACVLFLLYARSTKKIKMFVGENITRGVLEEVFEVEDYNSGTHISEDLIKSTGLIGGWNECSGSDFVRGKYRGRNIQFSDVKLEKVTSSTDSDGHSHQEKDTIFKGPWIMLEHDRELPASLRLREKVFSRSKALSDIETENAAFNQQFQILTTDGHTAFLILTPHFMEFLTSADAKAKSQTFICFDGNIICLALYNNHDLFEASGKNLKDINALREKQRAEIKYLTDVLDEIMKNDYLFGGKNPGAGVPKSSDMRGASDFGASNDISQTEKKTTDKRKPGIFKTFNPKG